MGETLVIALETLSVGLIAIIVVLALIALLWGGSDQ